MAGDFDGDGKVDMAVIFGNADGLFVTVMRNTCTPGVIDASSFATKQDFLTGSGSYGLTAADLDGDGKLDLATAINGNQSIALLRNTATVGILNASTFAPTQSKNAGATLSELVAVDLDGDGRPDLAGIDYGGQSLYISTTTRRPRKHRWL